MPTLAPPSRQEGSQPKTASEPRGDDGPSRGSDASEVARAPSKVVTSDVAAAPGPKAPSGEVAAICMYGRYEVLGRIAFGGMAEIFLGRENTSVGVSRYLAIKRILPHVAHDEQFVTMFLDEARLAIQLNHPNICHIYEFGELEGSYFIAMEWVNGVPLGKLIRNARSIGGVPPAIGARLIATVAEALHHAHRAKDALGQPMNIVHRDVNPHNIMVAYDGQVKLLDFGIAKATTQASKTQAGVVKGKFAYMAPEQSLGKEIDRRSDVFALGICLWETLTGEALFRRNNEYETMRAVIQEAAPPVRSIAQHLPEELERIVAKALSKKAEDRFQTAEEMQTALEEWISTTGKVVNAGTIAVLMDDLYEEQRARGPLVDTAPFGESFKRRKPKAPLDHVSASERESVAAEPSEQSTPPRRESRAAQPSDRLPTKPLPEPELPRPTIDPSALDLDDLDGFDDFKPNRGKGLALVVGLLILLLAGGAALSILRPDVVARLTGDAPEEPSESDAIVDRPEDGDLRVSAGEDAQILLFLGRSPATAEDLPVGVAHEVVVVAEGGVSRSVIPADAQWQQDGETPRYDLAMEVRSDGGGPLELGETELSPDGMGTPTGGSGTVRVITDPPGAKVYLLIGFGEAFVEDLPIDDAHELLIEVPDGEPERIVVGTRDWVEGPEGKLVEIDVSGGG